MRINKNLAGAVLMLSCIVLVLVGTTDFDSSTTKSIIMGILAVLAVTWALPGSSVIKTQHKKVKSLGTCCYSDVMSWLSVLIFLPI